MVPYDAAVEINSALIGGSECGKIVKVCCSSSFLPCLLPDRPSFLCRGKLTLLLWRGREEIPWHDTQPVALHTVGQPTPYSTRGSHSYLSPICVYRSIVASHLLSVLCRCWWSRKRRGERLSLGGRKSRFIILCCFLGGVIINVF